MEAARRAEAERLLGIAEKLLQNKDFTGSRDFAILAQETEPLLEGSDQILAVADVLLAADKRISNRHVDWYGVLQVDRRSDDLELIRKQYRRLALLLHPDKNHFAWADSAFRLVAEAWAVLSNAAKKSAFDGELGISLTYAQGSSSKEQNGFFTRVDLVPVDNNQRAFGFQQFRGRQEDNNPPPQQPQQQQQHTPVRRTAAPAVGSSSGGVNRGNVENTPNNNRVSNNFWTTCPYCYNLYEYPNVYIDCCLRCQNCERAFHAAKIETLPPTVPGKDAYYCYWGFFPIGFSPGEVKDPPPVAKPPPPPIGLANGGDGFVPMNANVSGSANAKSIPKPGGKKRGRPKKNPNPLAF